MHNYITLVMTNYSQNGNVVIAIMYRLLLHCHVNALHVHRVSVCRSQVYVKSTDNYIYK